MADRGRGTAGRGRTSGSRDVGGRKNLEVKSPAYRSPASPVGAEERTPAGAWSCSVAELLAAAGQDAGRHPVTLLAPTLQQLGHLQPQEAAAIQQELVADPGPLWERVRWRRTDHEQPALLLAKGRRADPVAARIQQLHAEVDAPCEGALDPSEGACLKADIQGLYSKHFGDVNAAKSVECFVRVAEGEDFFGSGEDDWVRVSAAGKDAEAVKLREQQKQQLTLRFYLSEVNIELQGQIGFCNKAAVGEVVNWLHPEACNDKQAIKNVHAQLLAYLKLAGNDQRFDNDLVGYLVEHYRVGEGGVLLVQLRERSLKPVQPIVKKASKHDAGVMLVTKQTRRAADAFWAAEIMPGLRKFTQVLRQLSQSKERLQGFRDAGDKKAWYAGQVCLVRS